MDRLLTEEEIKNAVYDTQEKGGVRWPKTVIPRDNKIAKAQDAKTARLVAQEIFEELENLIPMFYINHVQDYLAIKSKWGIE